MLVFLILTSVKGINIKYFGYFGYITIAWQLIVLILLQQFLVAITFFAKLCFYLLQLALKGSNYSGLLERHHIHIKNVEHVVESLR